jgi:hypothetical protein
MTLNLQADLREQWEALDPHKWTPLQTEVCMNVANAKLYAFEAEAERIAELIRLKLISKAEGADRLHIAAIYNQLVYEYGTDRVQNIVAAAFDREAAA